MDSYEHDGHDGLVDEGPTYVLDGNLIGSLEDFWIVIGEAVNGPDGYFARNLDALDDALLGGMGQPDDGRCVFVWTHSAESRLALGYEETVRQLEKRLAGCSFSARPTVTADLDRARGTEGPTVFDWLVEAFERSPAALRLK